MLFDPPIPLAYDPSLEVREKAEEDVDASMQATMQKIREKTLADGGHAIRSVHAKSHGLIQGELQVFDDLPAVMKQGLFAHGGRYPVIMRFSTIPGDILDDNVSTPRGVAMKIIGVDGPRLPGSDGDVTQDFVLVNAPAFNSPNAKTFAANLKLLAATTDKAEGAKKVLSAAMRGVEAALESVGVQSPLVVTLGGQAETHILGDTFYSQVPILYGDYIVKVSLAPISPELKALTKAHVDLKGKPDGLRESMNAFFATTGGQWELRVQFAINHHDTPIENAAHIWPEDKSHYLPVGIVTVQPQTAWSEARSKAVDDGLSFSPWHGLAAHRPLGSVMRARKVAYEQSAQFRAEHNGVVIVEPKTFTPLPE